MSKINHIILRLAITLQFMVLVSCKENAKPSSNFQIQQELWYDEPAENWMQALPVGNGRFGAMVFGNPNHERIQLNEDSMWAGGADWGDTKGTPKDLAELRKLLIEGKNHLVDSLIVERFSFKGVTRSHQTMGDLFLDFENEGEITNYKRSLSLNEALASYEYSKNGFVTTQKVFASAPDDVLIVLLKTDNPNGLNLTIRLNRPEDHGHKTVEVSNPSDTEISMKGMVTQLGGNKFSEPFPLDYGVKFETLLKAVNKKGSIYPNKGSLVVEKAEEIVLYLSGKTSFYHDDYQSQNQKTIDLAITKGVDKILADHKEDHKKYYNRVALDLGGAELDSLPTNDRLLRLKENDGVSDTDLAATLFQYGRYLLISSSRPGSNPANLQGIWNEHIEAPWNADYHVNINLQMNYWPANATNLDELNQPLFHFMDRVLERGKNTAKEQYGMEGAIIHHTSDLWATPWMRAARAYWGSWIHGGGWMGQHYWEHYRFTKDEDFLKERTYPYLKEIAAFYADWLVWDETLGKYVSTPETSPENSYIGADGKPAAISYGSAMGHQIIAEVFDNYLETVEILGIEDSLVKDVRSKREKLFPGVQLGPDGRILEWNEPYEEAEKGHRHMSHLYALHPGDDITQKDSAAFEGAQKVIDYRLQHGGAGTGWSRAWMINFNARLLDSVAAQDNIDKFFRISIADNLFDEHPPFQIDGNFGYTAGVAELLLQSHEGFLRILPTLPTSWKDGKIRGIKARENIEVDMEWKDGQLQKLALKSPNKKSITIKYQGIDKDVMLSADKILYLDSNLNTLKYEEK